MISNRYSDCFFAGTDFTALASFTAEATLLGGSPFVQPVIPPNHFGSALDGRGRVIRVTGSGVLSCTGTPTYLFTLRLLPTAASIGAGVVGVTAAITTLSGVTNKPWRLEAFIICTVPGTGSAATTLNVFGTVWSSGFASPEKYPVEPTTPDTATWTVTAQGEVQNYLNLSATCSASDAANTIRLKQLVVESLN